MRASKLSPRLRFAVAVATTIAALGATKAIEPWLDGTVLPLTLAAVVFASLLGGRRTGFAAMALGAVGLKYLLLPEVHTLTSGTASTWVRLAMFVGLAVPLVLLASSLRQACTRLEQAVRSRNDVLAVVSHDLRNPLGTIMTSLQMLREGAEAGTESPRRAAALARVWRAAFSMDRLVRDLLDFSRIETGTLQIRPQRCDLCRVLSETCEGLRPVASAQGLTLTFEGPPQASLDVVCDGDRVQQVVWNLVGNAIKFTLPGGWVRVSLRATERAVVVGVEDNGRGIPREALSRVFDRFWKDDTEADRGAGLGLAIVKGIVSAHGGEVRVESRLGEGTAFHFTLPFPAQIAQPAGARRAIVPA